MVWAIVVVAVAVLGVAAWAGTGRLGEMPESVTDRPKAHIPDGPVDQEFMETVSLPVASTGYRRSQVDTVLASHVAGESVEPDQLFDVVRRGYDMQAVDMILDRIRPVSRRAADQDAFAAERALLEGDETGAPVVAEEASDDGVQPEHALLADEARASGAPSEPRQVETVEDTVPPGDDFARQEGLEGTPRGDLPAT